MSWIILVKAAYFVTRVLWGFGIINEIELDGVTFVLSYTSIAS